MKIETRTALWKSYARASFGMGIARMKAKIKAKLAEIWGEEESAKA